MVHSVVPYCACIASRPLTNPCTQTWEGDMYSHDGQNLFVIDGHMHFWDANPENWRNKYGESWIKCFHAFHSGLSPAEEVWPFDKFCRYGDEGLVTARFRPATACSRPATSIVPSSTRPISMSSTRTASILTPKTTSSRPSIRTAFCCVALSTRGTKRRGAMPFARWERGIPFRG